MHLGQDTTAESPSWATGLLDFAKSAAGLYQQQRVFNANLATAQRTGLPMSQVAAQRPAGTGTNWTQIALLGGAGVLGIVLLMRLMR